MIHVITKTQIARHYPHRVDADPSSCPVCCGDGITNDARYGNVPADPGGWKVSGPWYVCKACDVWYAEED